MRLRFKFDLLKKLFSNAFFPFDHIVLMMIWIFPVVEFPVFGSYTSVISWFKGLSSI